MFVLLKYVYDSFPLRGTDGAEGFIFLLAESVCSEPSELFVNLNFCGTLFFFNFFFHSSGSRFSSISVWDFKCGSYTDSVVRKEMHVLPPQL